MVDSLMYIFSYWEYKLKINLLLYDLNLNSQENALKRSPPLFVSTSPPTVDLDRLQAGVK